MEGEGGEEGGGGNGDGGGGEYTGGEGDGGDCVTTVRAPQSVQSVPGVHELYSVPCPPSSQSPSDE
eukprot:3070090-Prymnesium_polylepis.3